MKLAIVTGGSKGLGKSLCEVYLSENWTVKELSRSAKEQYSTSCDFSDRQQSLEAVSRLFKELSTQSWDEVHLICNAGRLGQVTTVGKIDSLDWMNSVDVNFGSLIMSCGLFSKYFQSHDCPKVVAGISSGAANKDFVGWSIYCSTKAAMNRFITCFALEQSEKQNPIHSIIISPGVVDTQMQEQIRSSAIDDFPQLNYFVQLKDNDQLADANTIASRIFNVMSQAPQNGQLYRVADY